jgi:chromosome segregation ATPase
MAQKIATVGTVFAACDRLEAANERWNREDVRNEVGGGGYVVIDPLIKAWRALKPLREVAPTTPTELLHQVATSLENHLNDFVGEAESRLAENQRVFDTTVSELSERLAALESELVDKEERLNAMSQEQSALTDQLDSSQTSLNEAQQANARLVTENDGLQGRITRLETEHKEAIEKLNMDARALAKETARERARVSEEHSAALASQRQELTEAAEQAENRLMVLLDNERQAAKDSTATLTNQLAEWRDTAQAHREKTIELEAMVRQFGERNTKLETDLAEKEEEASTLSTTLQLEQQQQNTLQRDFDAYREEHKISGDLGALQAAVNALQNRLEKHGEE